MNREITLSIKTLKSLFSENEGAEHLVLEIEMSKYGTKWDIEAVSIGVTYPKDNGKESK